MGLPLELREPVRDLIQTLVRGDYASLENDGRSGQLTAVELETAIREYGAILVDVPSGALDEAFVLRVEGPGSRWALDIDLWSAEEGATDLTLRLSAWLDDKGAHLEIDDLHVL